MAAIKRKPGTLSRKKANSTMSSIAKQREVASAKNNYAQLYYQGKMKAIENARKGKK